MLTVVFRCESAWPGLISKKVCSMLWYKTKSSVQSVFKDKWNIN